MSEITRDNFEEKFPEIKLNIESAKFVAIDLEFSSLQPLKDNKPSLFDNTRERYLKLRKNLEHVIPVQVGLTAFHFDADKNSYFGHVYTFYVFPSAFAGTKKSFYFDSVTMQFLSLYNFDFNKLFYLGVPYVNALQELELSNKLKNDDISELNTSFPAELEDVIDKYYLVINKWHEISNVGDYMLIPEITQKYKQIPEIIYFLHKNFRRRFKNLWTYEQEDGFYIKKVTQKDFDSLSKKIDLNQKILCDLIGFRRVFQLLTQFRKPIIGHNFLKDLMIMINNFELPLPESYSQFKNLSIQLFPTIFDTKTLYYELRNNFKEVDKSSLDMLFNYFKNESGRHLAGNSPAIECDVTPENYGKCHEAGWDSFCTGYIFVRMAHFYLAPNYPKNKSFVSGELINGVALFKNKVNIIRGSSSHMKLDGEDPSSIRPPWLIVESVKNEPVDVTQVASLLSNYGFVEIKPISSKGYRVLVAVDNFITARKISRNFKKHPKFQVQQYNFLKHSPLLHTFLLTGLTISSGVLLWLSRSLK